MKLAEYPTYIGLDVARKAVQLCREGFRDDTTESSFLYDPKCFIDHAELFRADATISLDVIFYLMEDNVYEQYLAHLFRRAKRFVIIYSSNRHIETDSPH